ncbi:MAG: sigma-70 family RNA polymerase sigma factor [Chloracidobacterium sp.]|nr:sigma-70 family RNA polymerase sigma factor [Chloracidobacterium sp.]
MSNAEPVEITHILQEWNSGDEFARERLLKFVYDELKRRARYLMSRERAEHTMQPTELVHETYLKLNECDRVAWKDRSHFYAFASHLMRQILVDHARKHAAAKRGSTPIRLSTDDIDIPLEERASSILVIDEVMDRLALLDERKANIVEMRFFGGMTNEEIAVALETSGRTVSREWQAARIWLAREFSRK